jgi:hypothetical protein
MRPGRFAWLGRAGGALAAVVLMATPALAQEPADHGPQPAVGAPEPVQNDAPPTPILPEAPIEVPPPPPRHKGLVLEAGVGALQFLGQFKHVAPLATWGYAQLGYEPWRWLLLYGYGELTFTDTSEAEDETHARAFPIYGFGGGARITVHATERVAVFVQGQAGAMQADIPKGALADLGFPKAENLGVALGGRLGVEWYQMDRHLALGLGVGLRDAMGFQKDFGADTPLAFDATASIRYTF